MDGISWNDWIFFNAQSQSLLRMLAGMVYIFSTSASIQETSATSVCLSPISLQQQQYTLLKLVSEIKGPSMPRRSSSNTSLRPGHLCVCSGANSHLNFFLPKKKQQGSYSGCKSGKVVSIRSSQQCWRFFFLFKGRAMWKWASSIFI